jgi:hypothetical protein
LLNASKIELTEFTNNIAFWAFVGFDTVVYLISLSVFFIIFDMNFHWFLTIIFGYKILTLFFIKSFIRRMIQQN